MNISFFNFPISNTLPRCCTTVKQIYEYIISERAKENTQMLRSLVDGGVRRAYKAQNFDYVTFSGCFLVRKFDGLISHSGFMCFDIDHIDSEERLQEIKSHLINDELLHTVLLFRSPSGNGLKWVIEVPDRHWLTQSRDDIENSAGVKSVKSVPSVGENWNKREQSQACLDYAECRQFLEHSEKSKFREFRAFREKKENSVRDKSISVRDIITTNHRLLYERIREYLFEEYEIVCDATSDVARPCYLCHDPDAYYDEPTFHSNPAHKLLASLVSTDNRPKSTDYKAVVDCRPFTVDYRLNNWDTTDHLIRRIEQRAIDITGDYHDWVRLGFAFANTFGESGRGFYHRVSQFHPRYDYTQTNRQYDNCLKTNRGHVGLGSLVYLMNN